MWRRKKEPVQSYLDSVYDRILRGEEVFMGDVLDGLDSLDGPAQSKVTHADITAAQRAKADFEDSVKRFGLQTANKYQLCRDLLALTEKAPSPELLTLACDIICDTGLFLDARREDRTAEQDADCWLEQKENTEALRAAMTERTRLAMKFERVLGEVSEGRLHSSKSSGDRSGEAERIRILTEKALGETVPPEPFTDNLSTLLQDISASPHLTVLKPLFLYLVLTRHFSRLKSSEAPHIEPAPLWHRRYYALVRDNGRNYETAVRYLALFESLCGLCETEEEVDIPLCLCGFDRLSNLGEFYRQFPEERQKLPFAPQIEKIVAESLFTCCDFEENPVMKRCGISYDALDRFLSGTMSRHEYALKLLEKNINENLEEYLNRFLALRDEQAMGLCDEIMIRAAIPSSLLPRGREERSLFLAAIYEALSEAVDEQARSYLVKALKLLTGEI